MRRTPQDVPYVTVEWRTRTYRRGVPPPSLDPKETMQRRKNILVALLGVLTIAIAGSACSDDGPTDPPPPPPPPPGTDELTLTAVASGLNTPIYLTSPPGDSRLFVPQKGGQIRIIENGQLLGAAFLDISSQVSNGGEQGLLSMAFHPSYGTNGYFYVSYTDGSGNSRIERYTVSADANVANQASAKLILSVSQPFSNHNGGLIAFGEDGMLYIGLGDGGSGGDPQDHGQRLNSLLGALLRIDVDGGDPYAIPPGNPFVGVANAMDEIWAYGLRNPWRWAFDRVADRVYIADVGQNRWEELNVTDADAAGLNYGWRLMEGAECFEPSNCSTSGLTLPVLTYSIDNQPECAVVGGFVYRGSAIAGLAGHYFYSDNCAGWVRSFRYDGAQAADQTQWAFGNIGSVLSFGEDAQGELYLLSTNGSVYRLDALN